MNVTPMTRVGDHRVVGTLMLLAALLPGAAGAQAVRGTTIDIPFTKYVLDNGLTLVVHEDHKAPVVAVNVWYHVGSKDERAGKTGFAHLFEHLMFNGSEHYDHDYFGPFERAGATDMNGTTDADRTNYFQTVPTSALDMALWMESDRMGHLLGAITQEKLDEQRGVVQNEKRQSENQPYAVTRQLIAEATYPHGHPYSWTTIGSMEDLDAATLEDVRGWFRTYYGAANAVLSIAGDVDPQVVRDKVERYFADIPSGPPVARHRAWIAPIAAARRQVVGDRVPQARLYKVWNVPGRGTRDAVLLRLVTDVLAAGKSSRLHRRLVYDDQIATAVTAFVDQGEIGGQLRVTATVRPGEELGVVERAVDEELQRFLSEGPTPAEVDRAKIAYRAGFLRRLERVGGFGGKSDVLARGEVFGGRPDLYQQELEWVGQADRQSLHAAASRWMSGHAYVLEVHPFPRYTTSESQVDRTTGVPGVGRPPTARFPALRRATLPSGLEVILAERHDLPVIDFDLLFDAGFAADQDGLPGTATLAMGMLDEGTDTRTALEISEELRGLGARLGTGADLDTSYVTLSALTEHLDGALEIFADVVLHPAFHEADVDRSRSLQLARIEREKSSPNALAQRVFPALLYGADHAYGNPFTGTGTAESVSRITASDLGAFHASWLRPNNATLIVVGATTMEDLLPRLERSFEGWEPGETPSKRLAPVSHKASAAVYLVDRPGAQQSIILTGHIGPPRANPDEIALEVMNTILGGAFSSRLNQNLREDKGWSYGARSSFFEARGQRPFVVRAPVQTDKTAEAVQEILQELTGLRGDRPVTPDELARAKDLEILTLPGRWERRSAVSADIGTLVRFGLPDDHYDTLAARVQALDAAEISRLARGVLAPDRMIWVIVGDVDEIEDGLGALGIGPIRRLSADGQPLD